MKHLITLTLGGILGLGLLSSDAAACHKAKCGGCAQPVACAAPCAPVTTCAPRPKMTCAPKPKMACAPKPKKCGGLFSFCHNKKACPTCAAPVVAYYSAPVPSGQYIAAPQSAAPVMGAPQIPTKGTPQR